MPKTSLKACTLFAGPSLQGVNKNLLSEGLLLRPPIRRGDIDRLVSLEKPANIAIVDGIFHAYPAVGHAEILNAIHSGWKVWGLSSMGAIRACEMDKLGMYGFGEVYQQFASDPEMSDDEVTLIHESDAPFSSLSEPLVHIRQLLNHLHKEKAITNEQNILTVKKLKNMWYGDRTLSLLKMLLLDLLIKPEKVDMELARFSTYRIKTLDLINFLILKPWQEH